MKYEVSIPTTFIFNIPAIPTSSQNTINEKLTIDPQMKWEEFTSSTGEARFIMLQVSRETAFTISYEATVDLHYNIIDQKHRI